MNDIQADSPVVQLMARLWSGSQDATGHSWLRLNQGMREGLFLAIKIGLTFGEEDLSEILHRFRGENWFGADFESFYHCAVCYGNRSSWKAYENYSKRKPFIWTPAQLTNQYGGGGQGIMNPPRLTVGAKFTWNGEQVILTSFNDEKGYLIAQSYIRTKGESCDVCGQLKTWPNDKILHRYKITHDDLKQAKAKLKGSGNAGGKHSSRPAAEILHIPEPELLELPA